MSAPQHGQTKVGACEVFTTYGVTGYRAVQATYTGIYNRSYCIVFDHPYMEWDDDTTVDGTRVFAVWSEPVEASEPGTAMVLLMGIAGLIVSQRRKQA